MEAQHCLSGVKIENALLVGTYLLKLLDHSKIASM